MKIPKQAYTAEFKELAVKRIKDGQSINMVCKELGLSDQTARNWVKAAAEGKLGGAGGRVVTPEEMELSRLRAENLRLKRENEILKKIDGVLCKGCSVIGLHLFDERDHFGVAAQVRSPAEIERVVPTLTLLDKPTCSVCIKPTAVFMAPPTVMA